MEKMLRNRWFAVFAMFLIVSGCATWQYIPRENMKWHSGYFEAQLPKGWVKVQSFQYLLFLTRDGIPLQTISFVKQDMNKELPITKKKIKETTLVQETADLILNETTLNQSYKDFNLIENKPVDISGVPGFRLVYEFHNEDFVKYRTIIYGFILEKNYYEIRYVAAKQHYFDKNFPDFQTFMNSLKISYKGKA